MEKLPQLAAPGAGLPFIESLVVRYYLGPFVGARSDWGQNLNEFVAINDKILRLVDSLPPEKLGQKVLVPKQQGLEDSSRFWSVAMTLEHLVIVGEKMREAIVALSNEIVPQVIADTATVKPVGQMPPAEALEMFRRFVKSLPDDLTKRVKNPNAKARFAHPWFGPMPAKQWQWLLAQHSAIHYKQFKNIVKGL